MKLLKNVLRYDLFEIIRDRNLKYDISALFKIKMKAQNFFLIQNGLAFKTLINIKEIAMQVNILA